MVLAAGAAVTEDVPTVATNIFQRIGQDRQVSERPAVVNRGGHRQHHSAVARWPLGVERDEAEGIAGEVANDVGGAGDVRVAADKVGGRVVIVHDGDGVVSSAGLAVAVHASAPQTAL